MHLKNQILSISCILLSTFFLSGCSQKESYAEFMQHPQRLQAAIKNCEQKSYDYCDAARQAEQDFEALVEQRVDDPELFGQKIMQEQQLLVQLQQAFHQAQQTGDAEKLAAAEQAYRLQNEKTKTLYAVIIATSQGILTKE
jgi:outer membrane murein-binding lipoprotein Lpp